MKLLTNKMLIGEKIGDWTASETPDSVILWTKKKDFWTGKQSMVTLMATPHYDHVNEVAVDLCPDMGAEDDSDCLHTTIYLRGESEHRDKAHYLAKIRTILSILK